VITLQGGRLGIRNIVYEHRSMYRIHTHMHTLIYVIICSNNNNTIIANSLIATVREDMDHVLVQRFSLVDGTATTILSLVWHNG
jgi:hypothetical protein